MTLDQLLGLALALAIGLLVGAERGWQSRDEEPGGRVAGIRTLSLLGLLGGLSGLQFDRAGYALFVLLASGALLALLLGYRADMRRDDNVSATSRGDAALERVDKAVRGILTGHPPGTPKIDAAWDTLPHPAG
ncbi:MgtC/SapB family protein [Novosphingobium sp. Gsoil 351]|uniref:MgtC/SapB family protein n=1 Tax=Novosphingobium sp. Gsoil 351 TaxID=2675225 RepID=UPI0012B4A112|nr:MgtC/SapB family protein [Novosphingobium sp. Gsoil 351]QGN55819.1 hypothetical protein GKE62_15965 [Novosphingobium sp. Gsoil 351]